MIYGEIQLGKKKITTMRIDEDVIKKAVIPMIRGPIILADSTGFSLAKISLTIILKIMNAKIQPANGDNTQLAATEPTFIQFTSEIPPAINPKPINAPTIE